MDMEFMRKIMNLRMTKILALITPLLGGVGGGLVLGGLFSSCTDWDDHFDANTSVTESQRGSLLTNIKQNGQLNQFADLLEKTGYSSQLDQAQTFTVWAPKDNTFDYEALKNEQNDRILNQFIENHIARNNYPASGQIDERIYMLNKKVMNFTSAAGGYTIQDVALQLPSIGSNNGIIHMLDGKIPFLPNIYESLNNEQFKLDSISKFYHSFDTLILDENRSVKGPAVDGEITYLDAIYTAHNDLYSFFHADINREDSSYSMLMPTNEAWKKEYARVSQYFKYPEEFRVRKFVDITQKKDTTIKIVDPVHLQDSVSKMWILQNLFFNNRMYDNRKLADLKDGETLVCDSLVSTTKNIFNAQDAAEMLKGSTRVDKSNGNIFVTDEIKTPVWYVCPPVKVEAEYSNWLASYENTYGTPSTKSVTATNRNPDVPGTVSNNYYLEIQPYSSTSDEKVTFYLPNMCSATYHAFAVMLPSNITNRYTTEVQPNRFKVYFGYSNTNAISGRLELKEEQMKNTEGSVNFITDPTKVDTLDLGEVTFPTSYYGLGDNFPFIRFESNPRRGEHDRTLRIDCILLLPKELYERSMEDPNYKYIFVTSK